MNLQYVSGFFDADGYVTIIRLHKNDIACSPVLGFTNTCLPLIQEIKSFLLDAFSVKGYISTKKAAKENHAVSYDLKYARDAALKLAALLQSRHPKKSNRIRLLLADYKRVVKRNGKYQPSHLKELEAFHARFYA